MSGGINAWEASLLYTMKIAYTAANLTEYVGYAPPGTATTDTAWRIKKFTYDGNNLQTDTQFPEGSADFKFAWDSRTAYVYS